MHLKHVRVRQCHSFLTPFSSDTFFLLFPAHDQKSRNVEGLRRPDLNQIKTADGPMILTPRRTYAGRGAVRRTLYMAALVCTRHNPKLKAFYQRLLARGKQKKVAIIAVMRKLLVILNTMIKNREMWKDSAVQA